MFDKISDLNDTDKKDLIKQRLLRFQRTHFELNLDLEAQKAIQSEDKFIKITQKKIQALEKSFNVLSKELKQLERGVEYGNS